MNLNPDVINVNKLVRLGCREATDGNIKPRPLRFTVNIFDHKRQILKANSRILPQTLPKTKEKQRMN